MDPITGIGLAASVIQLVSFGIGAAKTCREIYEQGVSGDHSQVDYVASHLASLTVSIQQSLQNPTTQSLRLSKEERELVKLSQKCQVSAHQLQHEIQALRTKPHTSILLAASKAARALWKKNRIEQIQKQLESYRSTLEISLLSQLSQRFDAQALESGESFASLDKSLQHIIACLAKSETTLAAISVQEAEQTRQHTAAQIGHLERLYVDDRRFEEVMRSLFYPEIFSRQEQIANVFDGIESSYDWIFDKPQTHEMNVFDQANSPPPAPLWNNFACWLQSGHGVYWINGKAGSGKSTLMNHICGHNRRLELLQEWSSHRQLLTPSFFFWNSGSRQQKTINGLLRSLIYQMLNECRQLITCFEDTRIHAWTESRLLTFLSKILRQTQVEVAICMFIDGLDELDGQYDGVIKTITDLSEQRHVKICVSSRPLLVFANAFTGKPCLRLQDLTFDTIREYINLQLSQSIHQHASYSKKAQQRAKMLLEMIVERADGVFLWAVIATREVRDGLQGMVNLDQLAEAIEVLPPELESLFMLVIGRIKPAFQRDAAKFLQIILSVDSYPYLDLCKLYWLHSQQELQDAPFVYETIARSELAEACRTLKIRLLSHTAGLVELTPQRTNARRHFRKVENWDPIVFTRVDFSHRTVRDFLRDNNEAKSFLNEKGLGEAQVQLCIARGTLAHLNRCAESDAVLLREGDVGAIWPHAMLYPFHDNVLRHIAIAERLSRGAQSKFMQSLDYTSLVRGCINLRGPANPFDHRYQAYSKDKAGTQIDIIGAAAAAGMTIYVCERLGLSVLSAGYCPSLPDLESYSTSRATITYLSWKKLDEFPDTAPSGHKTFRGSSYRQALSNSLLWLDDAQVEDNHTGNYPLAESYILCCCSWDPTSIDLVRVLLKAGANPMVQVTPMNHQPDWRTESKTFWSAWLSFLECMRFLYMEAHGESGGILFGGMFKERHDQRVTLSDIFEVTKALLAQGADVNWEIYSDPGMSDYLKRRDLDDYSLCFGMSASAIFLLEECFNNEPEFQEFAVAISPLIKQPTRKIVSMFVVPERDNFRDRRPVRAADNNVLWPLIEKWERTGNHEDLTALEMAMEQIYNANSPISESESECHGVSRQGPRARARPQPIILPPS